MPLELPALPYDTAALEPHIDARTMEIHHGKHHQAYVTNANRALEGTEWADSPVREVLAGLDTLPEAIRAPVRNNLGGHANHSLFWETMAPDGGGEPEGAFADAISDAFGGVQQLKDAVNESGLKHLGSGWTWLVLDGTKLAVYSTPNQDSPLVQGDLPLLGIDVWEHAYYLRYQNRRSDYLAAWWNVVNWKEVGRRFEAARYTRDTPIAELQAWNERVIDEFRRNHGRVGGRHADRPILLLHTRGARSGEPRLNPLTYQPVGDAFAIFATKGGSDTKPAWYYNLLATESPRIEVGDESFAVRVRETHGEERDRIWERQKQLFENFAEYERLTDRVIPVIMLERDLRN